MTFAEQLAAALADRDAKKAAYDAAEQTYETMLTQAPGGGVDVSEHQGDVTWARVFAAGVRWAFIRCSDGDYNDPTYTSGRVNAVRGAGLAFGPYHFARVANDSNGQRDGKTEAAMAYYFARRQGWGKPGDLPLTYDFEGESYTGQTLAKAGAHLVQAVSTLRLLLGAPCILYSNPATLQKVVPTLDDAGRAELVRCPLWIANWSVTAPAVPPPWTGWTFWQSSNTGTVDGITGAVDVDWFSGTAAQLAALALT